jgi:hypothetical protein
MFTANNAVLPIRSAKSLDRVASQFDLLICDALQLPNASWSPETYKKQAASANTVASATPQ